MMVKKMNKVKFPDIQCDDVFSTCLLSVGNTKKEYMKKLERAADSIKAKWNEFDSQLESKQLHLISPCKTKKPNQLIVSDVTKKELMDLYSDHMLKEKSEARKIYNLLRASANGLCPFCGISGVKTLDHYLPKSRYPALSVNPKNLVPACENCNTGKKSSVFQSESDQTLYPYNDDSKFYSTQWISAKIIKNGFLTFEFFANPPKAWSTIERDRVLNHFEGYDLSSKYSLNSAQFVTSIMSNIRLMLQNGNYLYVQDHYNSLIDVVPVNSTLKTMYKAIASDVEVCKGHF